MIGEVKTSGLYPILHIVNLRTLCDRENEHIVQEEGNVCIVGGVYKLPPLDVHVGIVIRDLYYNSKSEKGES